MTTESLKIELTPQQQAAIAFHARLEGKSYTEIIDDRFPMFPDLDEAALQASLAMLDQSNREFEAGLGRDVEEVFQEIAAKHGFSIK